MADVGGISNIPILGNLLSGGPGGSSFGGGAGGGGLLGMLGLGSGGFSQTPTERAMTDALAASAANYGAQRPGLAQGWQNINSQVQNQFMPAQEALSMMYGAQPRATNTPAPGGNPGGNAGPSGGGSGGGGGGGPLSGLVDPLGILGPKMTQTIFDPEGVTGLFGQGGGMFKSGLFGGGGLLGGGGGGKGGGGLLGGLLGGVL